ncbi:MAG TPA: hypothetical protein VG604_04195 [Candidatus Saccharimonadales bacterium]|nr:hypothetical protein [Candidatus Saccharimonadales bacterium]
MKRLNATVLRKKVLICLAIGLVVTAITGLYARTMLGQHCGPTPESDNVIQCRLEGTARGLPLAYSVPMLPNNEVRPLKFFDDLLIWSLAPAVVMLKPWRLRRG